MITFTNVTKKYNDLTALSNINLTINDGEIFGLVGPSGAGKSTLLRTINKLEELDDGDIVVTKKKQDNSLSDIDKVSVRNLKGKDLRMFRKKVAMIFQHFALLQTKNVYYNIALPLKCMHYKKDVVEKRVNELAEIVGISDKLNNKPNQLSGGERQRVAIARALALEPEILLCDEATSALDPQTTKQILNLLKKINKELGITIVLVTHQMEVVKEICQRIAIIQKGKLLEVGKTEDLFLSSSSALKTLVDDQPILPKDGKSIKIYFPRQYTGDSLITRMARELNIDFSIVWGKLENFGDDVLGSLVINVKDKDFTAVLSYIKNEKISFEVLESEGN